MILCISQSNLDAYYYENALNIKYGGEQLNEKFIKFHHKKTFNEINTPELLAAQSIICLNSCSINDFKKLKQRLNRLKRKIKVFYSNPDFKKPSKTTISFRYLDTIKIFKHLDEVNLNKQSQKPFISLNTTILSVIKNSPYYDHILDFVYLKKDMNYEIIQGKKIEQNKQFFIKKDNYPKFSKIYQEAFLNRVKNFRSRQCQIKLLESIHDRTKEIGIDESTIDQTNLLVKDTLGEIKSKESSLHELLIRYYQKENFISEHSLLLSYVIIQTLDSANLYQNNDKIKRKLVLASLLHDIKLPKKFSHLESKNNNYTPDNEEFKLHPVKAVSALKTTLDEDLEKLILYHHENPSGDGIFHISPHSIPILCALFNTCHEFISFLYKDPSKENAINYLKKHNYNQGHYRKFLQLLENTFNK